MKNSELLSTLGKFKSLGEKKLPAVVGKTLAKNIDALEKEVSFIESERIKILKSYAKKDEKGAPVIVDNEFDFENEEAKQNAIIEINDFLESEADFVFFTVTENELEKCDLNERYDILTANQMVNLMPMVEE